MKYILITGCSNKSIGSALAQEFSTHPNLRIFATSRKLDSMSDLSNIPNITLFELDVTNSASVDAALAAVTSQTDGKLHYLLNYAGFGYTLPFLDSDIPTCRRMFDVNIWGVMRVTQTFAPLLIETKGMIIMAGSIAEVVGLPYQSAYCASKAALRMMSEALRVELGPLGVRMMYVTTGNIKSNWFNNVPEFELPGNSFYAPIEKQIEVRAKGLQDVQWMTADVYAKRVVNDILGGKEGRTYRGAMASLVKWAMMFMPQWLLEREMVKGTGLDVLVH